MWFIYNEGTDWFNSRIYEAIKKYIKHSGNPNEWHVHILLCVTVNSILILLLVYTHMKMWIEQLRQHLKKTGNWSVGIMDEGWGMPINFCNSLPFHNILRFYATFTIDRRYSCGTDWDRRWNALWPLMLVIGIHPWVSLVFIKDF